MICTRQSDCAATSHFSNCASMASASIYAQAHVDDLLATARKEAFKDAAAIASDFRRLDKDTLWARYKTLSLETAILERATTTDTDKTEKGMRDGPIQVWV